MEFKREIYYTNDYDGFAIYLVSKIYNDLLISDRLFNSISNEHELSDISKIYLFKLNISHLKESLKLFGKLISSENFVSFYTSIKDNCEIVKLLDDIHDELGNPNDYPNTVNAKYLDIRNTVFHYGTLPCDYEKYLENQSDLCAQNIDVKIVLDDNNKYVYEIGTDFPQIYSIFDSGSIVEIRKLLSKVIKICQLILNSYIESKI